MYVCALKKSVSGALKKWGVIEEGQGRQHAPGQEEEDAALGPNQAKSSSIYPNYILL